MAPVSPEQLRLIKDYEPVLYFHGGGPGEPAERFFPSDAKRYLERCALWKAQGEDDFGQNPVEVANRLAAIEGEVQGDRPIYIGLQGTPGVYDFLQAPRNGEYFLSLSDWKPAGSMFPAARRYADLDRLAQVYPNDESWYHAEFFDSTRLRVQLQEASATGRSTIDLTKLLQSEGGAPPYLGDPALICYYLFYPGHDEGLAGSGCSDIDQAREFASFAGEWSCVAVLLNRPAPDAAYAPKWIGLSNRNIGLNQVNGSEIRTGMRILSWNAVKPLAGTHPRLAVARGSHGLYLAEETSAQVRTFTPVDPSASSCGRAEAPASEIPETTSVGSLLAKGSFVLLGKFLAGVAAGSALGPGGALVGGIGGFIWGIAEAEEASNEAVPDLIILGPDATVDQVSTSSGRVVHPEGMLPPDVSPPERGVAWKSKDNLMIGGRRYDSTVDRDAQIIWPRDLPATDYTLRWGPRVVSDVQRRRAGMMFPNFWLMFFDTLVRAAPTRTVIFLTVGTTSWTVPDKWNDADNTIECIGGGGGGVDGNLAATAGTGGAGGGGAYGRITNLTLTPGKKIAYQVGAGGARGPTGGAAGNGGDTFFNGTSLATSSVGAKGGGGGNGAIGGAGGAPDAGVEFVTFIGGAGANGDVATRGSAGGGGAAGPAGNGATGSTAFEPQYGGGAGGGAGGGSPGGPGAAGEIGHSGGNNSKNLGGGTGGATSQAGSSGTDGGGGGGGGGNALAGIAGAGGAGGAGKDWKASNGADGGAGGGGGGGGAGRGNADAVGGNGGAGGNFGGGGGSGAFSSPFGRPGQGGSGAPGLIVISYRD